MAELTACILGLGETGISLSLALKRSRASFQIVGHDRDRGRMGVAQKMKAVDRTFWNVHRAVENADLIVLTIPFSELADLMPLLSETYKPQSLVLILASALEPVQALAQEHIPHTVSYVMGHPILTGINAPVTEREDLFDDTLFCLVPGPDTSPEAMKVVHNLIEHLGAKPHYLDAAEHDGLIAGVEHTAHVLAAAYMHAAAQGAGWQDARKLAGRVFHNATDVARSPAQLSSTLRANRTYVMTWLELMQREIGEWRRLLAEDEADALAERVERVHEERYRWIQGAALQDWSEAAPATEMSTSGSIMRQMLLGNLGSRRRRPRPDGDEERDTGR